MNFSFLLVISEAESIISSYFELLKQSWLNSKLLCPWYRPGLEVKGVEWGLGRGGLFILSTTLTYCIRLAGRKRLLAPLPGLAPLCGEVQEGQGSMMAMLCSQHSITSSYYDNEMFFRNRCLMPCQNAIYSWIFTQVQVNRLIWHVV